MYLYYPYTKVTGFLFVCVFVLKDLANPCTNFIGPRKVYNILGEGTTTLPREI